MAERIFEQALPIGFKLVGGAHNYIIEQVLGQGGFGITYKVKARIKTGNINVTTHFAVKEFFPSTCWRTNSSTKMLYAPTQSEEIKESLADFIYEGRRLQGICSINPNIVKVNEVFEANDTAYYVMEYLEGGDLRKLVKENNNKLNEQQMLNIMIPIGNSVQCLHDNNMLHLDIKPDNIVMRHDDETNTDVPVLIDFGLATHFDPKGTPTSKTPSMGISAGYSPIEQYTQLQHFDPRLDVYAFSATCFYLLTGKDPVDAINLPYNYVASMLPSDVSTHISKAIERGMSKENVSRTASINDLLDQLITVTAEEHVDDMPPQLPPQPKQNTPQNTIAIPSDNYVKPNYVNPNFVSPAYSNDNNDPTPYLPDTPEERKSRKPLIITLVCVGALILSGLGIWGVTSLLNNGKSKNIEYQDYDDEDSDGISLQKSLNDTIYSEALLNAAHDGDSDAQNILGECYYEGRGTNIDMEKAARWFHEAAEQGNVEAQFSIGACYYDGEGVEQDYEQAARWFTTAADNGHVTAQYFLGLCYDNGYGVSQDATTAAMLYEKAANQGLIMAINDLGVCYQYGEGVERDISKAVELFSVAANEGYPLAQFNLGFCYENGMGVQKDLDRAVELYNMAAEQGEGNAIVALERLRH